MLQVPLSPDTEALLRQRAAARGEDVSTYAAQLLQNALNERSADELLAPFRKQIEESGVSDEELDAMFESLREEVWQEHRSKKDRTE